ncbi:MAG TPA: hypothetical protein VGK36_08940 [Candidatus Angelobacter sp.]|jgi:hypothetical protein
MLRSALEGEQPALFSDRDPLAGCVACGRARPLDVIGTWLCQRCKAKPLVELVHKLKGWVLPAERGVAIGQK